MSHFRQICSASTLKNFSDSGFWLRCTFFPIINLQFQPTLLALHARLSSLLSTAEYLDGSELPCFGFDEHLRCFAATHCASPITVQNMEMRECSTDFDQQFSNLELKHEIMEQDLVSY